MQVRFQVLRQDQQTGPRLQSYTLAVEPGQTILDCLNQIKWEHDGSLAFRKNCRNTICGSCAVRINGRSALACKENVGQELARLSAFPSPQFPSSQPLSTEPPTITIGPLGNMPVIKDLVVDMASFWNHLEAVDPYVSSAGRQIPQREFLQPTEERSRLSESGNCILCGACYSECNAREINPSFVGPHALAKAYRMVADSRDSQTEQRLNTYAEGTQGVWGCTRCYYCNTVCPMEVAPLDQISHLKQEVLVHQDGSESRSVRHRKTLVELMRQGGWLDERRFGFRVVSNSFRDIQGLLSLLPLGFRMLARRKLPLRFEASSGTATVRALIDAVRMDALGQKREPGSLHSDPEHNPDPKQSPNQP